VLKLKSNLRCLFFSGTRGLLEAVTEGKVCGVLALHVRNGGMVEDLLRHDLKHLPGYEYEDASYAFPPARTWTYPTS
jgi:hypothetical protein